MNNSIKKPIYILTSFNMILHLEYINDIADKLFFSYNTRDSIKLKSKLNKLISYLEGIPTFGEKTRKTKFSIYWRLRMFILNSTNEILRCIEELEQGRKHRDKREHILQLINELKNHIYNIRVYCYNDKAEGIERRRDQNLFDSLKNNNGKYRELPV